MYQECINSDAGRNLGLSFEYLKREIMTTFQTPEKYYGITVPQKWELCWVLCRDFVVYVTMFWYYVTGFWLSCTEFVLSLITDTNVTL